MTDSFPEVLMEELRPGSRRGSASEPTCEEALDVLFRRHYTQLLRLAIVMLGDREAAEDAVQDSFVALHRHWRSIREPGRAEAYLRSAVLNRCRSWIRRQVTQRSARPLMLVPADQESAEETTIGRDEVGALVSALRSLARRQREVLACRFVLELSVAETAHVLGISEGSVKTHAHRGLQALEQRIEAGR